MKIIFLVGVILLLFNTAILSRDYQDGWILEGLEIQYILFLVVYVVVFFSEKKVKRMVVLAILFRFALLLIPTVKYVWFYGIAIDQHQQYCLANYILDQGRLVPTEHLGHGSLEMYTTTPGIHLLLVNFSIVTGIQLLESFKFCTIILASLYPLLTHVMIGKLGFPEESRTMKYSLFFSSIISTPALSFVLTGSMFGVFLSFFVFIQLMKLSEIAGRGYLLLFLIFNFVLIMTHSFSALLLSALIGAILILHRFRVFHVGSLLNRNVVLLIMVFNFAWLLFQAPNTLSYVTGQIASSGVPKTGHGHIPTRFFELASTTIFEAAKTTLVLQGIPLFFMLLAVVGVVVAARKGFSSNTLKLLCLVNVLILLFLFGGIGLGIGTYYWKRVIRFTAISSATFFGLITTYISGRRLQGIAGIVSIIGILALSPLVFGCQPIVSPANTLLSSLPADEPIVYVVGVNSAYQRNLIRFAEHHVHGRIACDLATRNQLIGLTSIYFWTENLVWAYPLSGPKGPEDSDRYYDDLLIHLPGRSGGFLEQAEARTTEVIEAVLDDLTQNVVYSNKESCILHRTPVI